LGLPLHFGGTEGQHSQPLRAPLADIIPNYSAVQPVIHVSEVKLS